MPSAITQIASLDESLSKAERKVANYILRYPERIPFLSVSEIAIKTDVSVASVSRLSKRAGYKNFREFKIVIAQETAVNLKSIYEAITPGDSDEEIVEKIFGGTIRSLENTLATLDICDLIKAAKLISSANKLVFMGMGSSGNIARDAALRFSSLGLSAHAYIDPYQMIMQGLNLGAGNVAVGISHSGRSKTTMEGLKLARKSGATIIGISNYLGSPLNTVSNIFFCTAFPEKRVKAAALSSKIDQICLIDCLYVLVARRKKETSRIEQLNKVTDELLRLKNKR